MEIPYSGVPLDLQKREIRLVKLEHSKASERIKCSLRSYSLDDDECPAYVALSYAWESKERYDDLELNGHTFPIGRSLWSFLHQMRAQHLHMTFWIDALSINQSNVLEQNHQVQMMRRIYTHAHTVWVWLGEADNDTNSDIAMQYLKTREPVGETQVNYRKLWSPRKARAVLSLCERAYWKRIWIVQEIMLARKATILCGDRNVGWSKLQQLITDLQMISDCGRAIHTIGVSEILESPATTIIKAKAKWDGSPQPLTTLLEQYHNQEATDIRDRVYALHGLASNSSAIAVEYRIDPKALLVEIIYHACSAQASKTDAKRSKKDLLRLAKMMRRALQVECNEEELDFHVSVARGDGIALEKDSGLRVRGRIEKESPSAFQGETSETKLLRATLRFHCLPRLSIHGDPEHPPRGTISDQLETPIMPQWPSTLTSQSVHQTSIFTSVPKPITTSSATPVSAASKENTATQIEMEQSEMPPEIGNSVDDSNVESSEPDSEAELEPHIAKLPSRPSNVETQRTVKSVRRVSFMASEPASPSEDPEYPARQPRNPPVTGNTGETFRASEAPEDSSFTLRGRSSGKPKIATDSEDRALRYDFSTVISALRSSGALLSADDTDDEENPPAPPESLLQATMDQRLQHSSELREIRSSLESALVSDDSSLITKVQRVERNLIAKYAQHPASNHVYDCIFWFLNCEFKSTDAEAWKTHTLTHFNPKSPPNDFSCHLCPTHRPISFHSTDGHETWAYRLNHYMREHAAYGWGFIALPPCDIQLFQYLRDEEIVSAQEYKTLVTKGWLEWTPRTYVQSRLREKKRGRGKKEKKGGEELWGMIRDVYDGKERSALRSVVKYLGLR